jgi:hypothetical protein
MACTQGRQYTALAKREEGAVVLRRTGNDVACASIQQIYFSRADPAGDPYDSAGDLTSVILQTLPITPLVIPAGTAMTLEVVYNLDEKEPLLIAVDFSASPPSGITYSDAAPQQAAAYWYTGAHAALKDRGSGFTATNRIYLVEKIEVSSGAIS